MIVPILVYGSPCYGLSRYVMTQLENVQKRVVKWIVYGELTYKDALLSLSILPLPMYIQINNLLTLAKLVEGRYDTSLLKIPLYTESSRRKLFQLSRPARKNLEENFFFRTCRLSDVLGVNIRDTTGLKKRLLRTFWDKFNNYDERNKCTWRLACDYTTKNWRSKLTI